MTFLHRAATSCCWAVALATVLSGCGARTPLDLVDSPSDGGQPGDAVAHVDGALPQCGGAALVETSYLFDGAGTLYRYDPRTTHATVLGTPNCGNDNVPWTMTVSRANAYIVYTDWTLYAVDLATLHCSQTAFQSGQLGIDAEFGVAVSGSGGTERLFVYGETSDGNAPILAVGDLTSFVLTKVGDIAPVPQGSTFPVNLTADSTGLLYAYSPGGFLQQIDSATGVVVQSAQTNAITMATWASLTSGSNVWLFADSMADEFDFAARSTIATHDVLVFPIGGGTTFTCPSSSPR